MFDNFLYLIIALLIHGTYQTSDIPRFSIETALLGAGMSAGVFWFIVRRRMGRFLIDSKTGPFVLLDHRFDATVRQLSILAIALFAIDLYGFELPAYLETIPLFAKVPTLSALVFLGIFIGYLAIVWSEVHGVQEAILQRRVSKREHLVSNLSMALPVVLPWLILSAIVDIIDLLPFETPKRFLASSEGEAIFFVLFLFFMTLLGPVFIRKIWRCRPLENGPWRDRIEDLSRRAGCVFADIVYWPVFGGRMITAGVMGLVGRFRYLLVTESLLSHLSPEEIDAVVAHEIGHVKKRHLYFYLLFFGGYLLFYYSVFDMLISLVFFSKPFRWLADFMGGSPGSAAGVVATLLAIVLFSVYFRYIFGFFMRNFERQADAYVFTLFHTAGPLVSTFEKITRISGESPDRPSWHHFSIRERVAYLQQCELDRGAVQRHNRKVRFAIAGFLVGLVGIGIVGYQLNFGGVGRQLDSHLLEKLALGQLEENSSDPDLAKLLGDLYQERKDYEKAIKYYNQALSLNPSTPDALNNLAWLYATAEDGTFREPKKALSLALRAVRLAPAPHILDTLAESYYVNKRFEEAYATARRALNSATENKSYFEGQVKKFEKALRMHGDAERHEI